MGDAAATSAAICFDRARVMQRPADLIGECLLWSDCVHHPTPFQSSGDLHGVSILYTWTPKQTPIYTRGTTNNALLVST